MKDAAKSITEDSASTCNNEAGSCKLVNIHLVKQPKEENPENRDMEASDSYYFQLTCAKEVSKNEPRFKISSTVRPTASPCKQTMMVTMGLFPFQFPLGIEADLMKCGAKQMLKLKNIVELLLILLS